MLPAVLLACYAASTLAQTPLGVGTKIVEDLSKLEPCRDTFGNLCAFSAGQVFDGTFGVTARAAQQTGKPFTLTIAPHNYAMLASEGQHIVFERWVATDDFVTIADLGASRPGIGCPANQLAKYAVHWSDQCNVVTLRQRNDPCARRGGLLRGQRTAQQADVPLTLRLRPCVDCANATSLVGHLGHGVHVDTKEPFQQMWGGDGALIVQSPSRGVSFLVVTPLAGAEMRAEARVVGGQYRKNNCTADEPITFELVETNPANKTDCTMTVKIIDELSKNGCADLINGRTEHIVYESLCAHSTPPTTTTPTPTTTIEETTHKRPLVGGRRWFPKQFEVAGVVVDHHALHAELERYDLSSSDVESVSSSERSAERRHQHHHADDDVEEPTTPPKTPPHKLDEVYIINHKK